MDAKIRDEIRYLKTLSVEDRLVAVLNLADSKEIGEAQEVLSAAIHMKLMRPQERSLYDKLRRPDEPA